MEPSFLAYIRALGYFRRKYSCRAAVKGGNRRFPTKCVRACKASDDRWRARAQELEEFRPTSEARMWATELRTFTGDEVTVVHQPLPAEVSKTPEPNFRAHRTKSSRVCEKACFRTIEIARTVSELQLNNTWQDRLTKPESWIPVDNDRSVLRR